MDLQGGSKPDAQLLNIVLGSGEGSANESPCGAEQAVSLICSNVSCFPLFGCALHSGCVHNDFPVSQFPASLAA